LTLDPNVIAKGFENNGQGQLSYHFRLLGFFMVLFQMYLPQGKVCTRFVSEISIIYVFFQLQALRRPNNFINFCLTTNKPIGNGKQVQSESFLSSTKFKLELCHLQRFM